MEVTATENEFFLESVSYFEDAKMALDPTAQGVPMTVPMKDCLGGLFILSKLSDRANRVT